METQPVSPVITSLLAARTAYAPPPELTVSEFSDQEIILTNGPLAGTHWQTDFAPYQRGILDVFHELGVEIAVIMGSSQWGKTACCVNIACYHIAHNPCPILIVEPVVDPMAKDFAKNRLEPVIAASPRLREVVSKRRAKDASNTTLAKTFRGGSLAIAGANSASSLASRPVQLLICDEIDRYPAELPGEGSTIAIAMKRTSTYRGRRRVLLVSSPTLEGGPIHSWYGRGDERKYFVPCPGCGGMHPYEWKNVKWTDRDPSTARLHCPACDYAINDAERVAVLAMGEWRPTQPHRQDTRIVSFHLWEAYSPMSSLQEIVSGFLFARAKQKIGEPAEMHTWQNTTLGEPRAMEVSAGVDADALFDRREPFDAEVPSGACLVTLGVDVQDDRLEALALAWGPGEECWLIDRQTFAGDTSQPDPWDALGQLLDRQYLHASGVRLGIAATCIDSGGHRTTMVYEYAALKATRRVFAIIGRDGQRPIVSSPSPRRWGRGSRQVPLYTIGVDAAKAIWMGRFKVVVQSEAPHATGPGAVHLPLKDWCDEELMRQLTSEALVTKFSRGIPVQVWQKRRARNEGLDCGVYGLGALRLLHPNLDEVFRQLQPDPGDMPPPAPPDKPHWIPPRPGWLRGRR